MQQHLQAPAKAEFHGSRLPRRQAHLDVHGYTAYGWSVDMADPHSLLRAATPADGEPFDPERDYELEAAKDRSDEVDA